MIWFLLFAIISIVCTIILVKFLDSSAKIKHTKSQKTTGSIGKHDSQVAVSKFTRREFILTGACAIFLTIFFASWYMFVPYLTPKSIISEVRPSSIPQGFKPFHGRGYAFAIPDSWDEPLKSRQTKFGKNFSVNETDFSRTGMDMEGFNELKDSEGWKKFFKAIIPGFKIRGPVTPVSIQGRRGARIDLEIDKEYAPLTELLTEEEKTNDRPVSMYFIVDDKSMRLFVISCDSDETAQTVISTLAFESTFDE